jgi:uncharacterized protein (TIGR02118 family)
MTVLRVGYKSGIRFDEDYYLTKHIPLAGRVMGPFGVKAVEVVRIVGTPDGSPAPYQLMFSAHFESAADAAKAMQSPEFSQVLADIPNYYGGAPDVMIGEVVSQ